MSDHSDESPPHVKLPTLADADWALRCEAHKRDELDKVRESGSKWQSALAGLSGLLMTGLALSAPFLASNVQDSQVRTCLIVGVVCTLVMLGVAGWLATYASAGMPQSVQGSDAFRDAVKKKVKQSVIALKWATGLYVAAQLALVVTVVMATVNSSGKPAGESSASVLLQDGRQFCGSIVRDSPSGKMRLELEGGQIEEFNLRDVTALQPVASC